MGTQYGRQKVYVVGVAHLEEGVAGWGGCFMGGHFGMGPCCSIWLWEEVGETMF